MVVDFSNGSIMENKKYLRLNDIAAYRIAFHLSNYVWGVVIEWDYFAKQTIGKQFVEAVDSISANIAEGFGRYGKRDKTKYYIISRASVSESLDWNEKGRRRKLLKPKEYEHIYRTLIDLPKEINSLIKYIHTRLAI